MKQLGYSITKSGFISAFKLFAEWYFFYQLYFFKKIFLMFVSETERDRAWVGGGGRERGRHRIRSRLQALSCQQGAWREAQTHKPWDHDLSWSWSLNRLSHPGDPHQLYFWSTPPLNNNSSEEVMAENFLQINVRPQTTDPGSLGNTKQDKYQKTKTNKRT